MQAILPYLHEHYGIDTLGDITWAHAVNSQERLQRYLHDEQTMILEVDVRLSARGEVVLAHPPALDSDLSFTEFLRAVAGSPQGIKLDLKDAEVLIPCLVALKESDAVRQPVIMNAGLVGVTRAPKFNPTSFVAACRKFYPQAILSPDWEDNGGAYTAEQIDAMLAYCQGVEHVTFPVNARRLRFSLEQVTRLLQPEGYSLTIWDGTPVDEDLRLWLLKHTDPAKVSYDCADEQGQRLAGMHRR